jgi:hypothetical protein
MRRNVRRTLRARRLRPIMRPLVRCLVITRPGGLGGENQIAVSFGDTPERERQFREYLRSERRQR